MPTAPPSTTTPPAGPSRASPSTFSVRADAWVAWLETYAGEVSALAANVYGNAVEAQVDAVAAASSAAAALASQNAAAASAQAAAASAGASIWVSGTTYSIGDVRWSPATRYTYRRITDGAGTTDPSIDTANWALLMSTGEALALIGAGVI